MDYHLSRRGLLQTPLVLSLPPALRSAGLTGLLPAGLPAAAVVLHTEAGSRRLVRQGSEWTAGPAVITSEYNPAGLKLRLRSPGEAPLRVQVRWAARVPVGIRILGDAWERSYGELAFRSLEPERILPWYALAVDGGTTHAFGVKTGAGALCYWQVDPEGVTLWCDVRNGGGGVQLGGRELALADVVARSYTDRSPFHAAQDFCQRMCEKPRLPKLPVYGGNNWYYAYGHSSADDIRADSERIASVSEGLENRPVMVIDDGWQPNSTRGPWRLGNAKFPDMAQLATDMRKIGVRPGLWTRPLFTKQNVPEAAKLRSPNAEREWKEGQTFTLDPTAPEAAELISGDMKTVITWGYELIKHDFSTYDLLGRWGYAMNSEITDENWSFHERTHTNAEIILDLYRLLRTAAGETEILGCNTVGHLSAGIFEAQRTGDDTSGREWERTRKMGVNTLAFRMPQHGSFFAIDADCVGLTKDIDWKWNRQWLDLLACSGTPLFVSVAPDALGEEQRAALKSAFQRSSKRQAVAEPVDWIVNNEPRQWSAAGKQLRYEWWGI